MKDSKARVLYVQVGNRNDGTVGDVVTVVFPDGDLKRYDLTDENEIAGDTLECELEHGGQLYQLSENEWGITVCEPKEVES